MLSSVSFLATKIKNSNLQFLHKSRLKNMHTLIFYQTFLIPPQFSFYLINLVSIFLNKHNICLYPMQGKANTSFVVNNIVCPPFSKVVQTSDTTYFGAFPETTGTSRCLCSCLKEIPQLSRYLDH